MSWEDLSGDTVSHVVSAAESRRFGITVGRVTAGWHVKDAADELTRVLRDASEEVLVVRWPSHLLTLSSAAVRSGRIIIPADTLTYWEVPVGQVAARDMGDAPATTLTCSSAAHFRGEPLQVLTDIVQDSFRAYGNHYLANPGLDPDRALEGYVEWATRSLAQDPDDIIIMARGDEAVGVATLAHASKGKDLEVLLAGIVTEHQSRGWYRHLFEAIDCAAQERMCDRVIISTQAHNVRVQRVWARLGLLPFATFTTVHATRPVD